MPRAAVLYEFNTPLVVEEIEVDPPRSGEVMVRLAASGVCHSDLHSAQGIHPLPLPVIMGHEGSGVVEEVGEGVGSVRPGDHVILSWLPYCGRCRFCTSGRPALCDNLGWSDAGTMMDGTTRFHRGDQRLGHNTASSFAELTVVPEQTVIAVDPSLDLTELALLGCAVMTGTGAVFNTAGVRPGESVAVVGCGGVGLSVIQGARIAGAAPIIAVDPVASKRDLALTLGASHAVDPSAGDAADAVRQLAGGGVDVAFEALGRPETILTTLDLVGKGGKAVLVGMAPPEARVPLDALTLTLQERSVLGCWYGSCRPPADFARLLGLYRCGDLDLRSLVTTTISLEMINDAFGAMEAGEAARTVITYGR
ncbi:MAG: Zn-dependent alcohol dehydrogenase [Acidimicrobiales bacterium]